MNRKISEQPGNETDQEEFKDNKETTKSKSHCSTVRNCLVITDHYQLFRITLYSGNTGKSSRWSICVVLDSSVLYVEEVM